jgi:hypothetical protein
MEKEAIRKEKREGEKCEECRRNCWKQNSKQGKKQRKKRQEQRENRKRTKRTPESKQMLIRSNKTEITVDEDKTSK